MIDTQHKGRHIHYFDTLGEFINATNPDKIPTWSEEHPERGRCAGANSWNGGRTVRGIWELVRTGRVFNSDLLSVRDRVATQVRPAIDETCYLDVSGGTEFDMGAFVEGQPECVWSYRDDDSSAKNVVSLLFNGNVSCGIDPSVMRWQGIVFMALVDALEMSGRFRVNVYYCFASHGGNRGRDAESAVVVKLKDASQHYDPQAIAAVMVEPSFFRHTCFSYWDIAGVQSQWGVGAPTRGRPATLRSLPDTIDPSFVSNEARVYSGNSIPIRNESQAVSWIIEQMIEFGIKLDARTHD